MTLIKDRSVGALFIHRICLAVGVGVIWAFFPLMADEEFHLSSTLIGLVLMANVALGALCLYPMGLIADKIDKRIPAVVGGIVGSLALALLIYAKSLGEVLTIGIAHGLAFGIVAPSMMAVAVIAGREVKAMGTVMGVISMAHSLGMLIGPTLGGLVMDALSFAGVFLFACVVMMAGTIFLLFRLPSTITAPAAKRRKMVPPIHLHE
jgi:MFS family permease